MRAEELIGVTSACVALVAGIDSSTQSCKVVICDADTGEIVRSAIVAAPRRHRGRSAAVVVGAAGQPSPPPVVSTTWRRSPSARSSTAWCVWTAAGAVVRDALLWNDTRSSAAAAALVAELGGPGEWAKRIGVVPVAAITAAKLRWLADHEPANADATAAVCLPHDWLTWRLSGSTDIADAAHRPQRRQRHRLLLRGVRRLPTRPARVGAAGSTARRCPRCSVRARRRGSTPTGAVLGPGAGDNAAAALGLAPGRVTASSRSARRAW